MNGYSFKWDIPDNIKMAKELAVKIPIETDYGWGTGWTQAQEDRLCGELYSMLIAHDYDIEYAEDSFSSDTLIQKGTNLKLYMHPMEFTGFASPEQIKELTDILNECEYVYNVGEPITKEVLNLNERGYKNLLSHNAKGIMQFIEECRKNHVPDYDIGMEFARYFRLDFIKQDYLSAINGGRSSFDADVSFVDSVVKLFNDLEIPVEKINELMNDNKEMNDIEEEYDR